MENDLFQFRITLRDVPLTRRGVLSTINSVYDPLGFLAPVILKGKKILQQLCRDNSDWDTFLSDKISAQWESWRTSLFLFESLEIKDVSNLTTLETSAPWNYITFLTPLLLGMRSAPTSHSQTTKTIFTVHS